jgi:hypothetical protein
MNNCITIEDIYEKSNISDIDIHIENMISLRLENKDYSSALNIINYTLDKLMNIVINITNSQIDECKENNQNNIITMTRYIDTSVIAYNNIEKKNQEFGSKISYINNLRSTYIDYINSTPIHNININYDYKTARYTMLHAGIYYNMGPCKFVTDKENKTNNELVITQRYCFYLINKLFSDDINNYMSELLQLGSCIVLTILDNKKIKHPLSQ